MWQDVEATPVPRRTTLTLLSAALYCHRSAALEETSHSVALNKNHASTMLETVLHLARRKRQARGHPSLVQVQPFYYVLLDEEQLEPFKFRNDRFQT